MFKSEECLSIKWTFRLNFILHFLFEHSFLERRHKLKIIIGKIIKQKTLIYLE